MLQHEVLGKSQSLRPHAIRLDPGRIGSIGETRRPERILTRVPAGRQTVSCVGLLEKIHRSSSRSVTCLPTFAKKKSNAGSRRENISRREHCSHLTAWAGLEGALPRWDRVIPPFARTKAKKRDMGAPGWFCAGRYPIGYLRLAGVYSAVLRIPRW